MFLRLPLHLYVKWLWFENNVQGKQYKSQASTWASQPQPVTPRSSRAPFLIPSHLSFANPQDITTCIVLPTADQNLRWKEVL